jgi:sec-independent protein translocase protein TatA
MGSGLVSPVHIVFLVIAALLLFGAKRLPEIGRSLGHGMREFKESVTTTTDGHHEETRSELPTTSTVSTPDDERPSKAA